MVDVLYAKIVSSPATDVAFKMAKSTHHMAKKCNRRYHARPDYIGIENKL